MTKLSRMILMAGLVGHAGIRRVGGAVDRTRRLRVSRRPKRRRTRSGPSIRFRPRRRGCLRRRTTWGRSIQEELKVKQEIPDYYPEDAPIYPGSLPSNIRHQGSTVTLAFGTKDAAAQVVDFMRSDLNSNGWTILPAQELPNGTLIQGTKDGRTISVLVAGLTPDPEGESTMMMVSVQR